MVAAALQRHGVRVSERGIPQLRIMRVDGGASAMGIRDDEVLPTIVTPPTPAPLVLPPGPRISLSGQTPLEVTYGFAPPKVDRQFNDGPIVMRGVRYDHGLGTHAWCRMTYAVPDDALSFEAVVGLSDDVRDCALAPVTFE